MPTENQDIQDKFEARLSEVPEELRTEFRNELTSLVLDTRKQLELKRKLDPNSEYNIEKEIEIRIDVWIKIKNMVHTYGRYAKLMEELGKEPVKFKLFKHKAFVPQPHRTGKLYGESDYNVYSKFNAIERKKIKIGSKLVDFNEDRFFNSFFDNHSDYSSKSQARAGIIESLAKKKGISTQEIEDKLCLYNGAQKFEQDAELKSLFDEFRLELERHMDELIREILAYAPSDLNFGEITDIHTDCDLTVRWGSGYESKYGMGLNPIFLRIFNQ